MAQFDDPFDLALQSVSEQGSLNWQNIRAGRFTSSEMHRLMSLGKRPMTEKELAERPKKGVGSKVMWIEDESAISEDTITYIREKVAETLTGDPRPNIRSQATEHGETWEPFAAEYFAKIKGCELEIVPFLPIGDHAGGSPDRYVIWPDGRKEGLEIKCPHNPANQILYLELQDQYDLKREYPEIYWQCQSNMLFSGLKTWNLATFDPRMKEDKYKLSHLVITWVDGEWDLITKKIELAVKEKLKQLYQLDKLIEIKNNAH